MWLCISGTEFGLNAGLESSSGLFVLCFGFVCLFFVFVFVCLFTGGAGRISFIVLPVLSFSLGMALHDETVDGVKDEKLKQYKIHSLLYCQCFLKKINEYTRHIRLWWFKTIHGLLVLNCCVKLASQHRFTDGESIWHRNLKTIKYSFLLKILNVNRLKFLLLMLRQWITVLDSHATC